MTAAMALTSPDLLSVGNHAKAYDGVCNDRKSPIHEESDQQNHWLPQ